MKKIVDRIKKVKREGRWVFTCGNGGSSATAEHFSNDLFKKGVRSMCLNSNSSIMTMISNDYGFQYVFSKQLETFYTPGDLLVVFSVSGISPNIVYADTGVEAIRFFGKDGESYEEAEDRHLKLAHDIAKKI